MNAPKTFKIGQRWASESQPELGLGVIEKAGSGRVTVYFAAADERLTYAAASAPLRRVTFGVGDKVRAVGGAEIEVIELEEDAENGLMLYVCEDGLRLPEGELAASSSGARPEARLKAARPDENQLYELRKTALEFQEAVRGREVAGFLGGEPVEGERVLPDHEHGVEEDLLPHLARDAAGGQGHVHFQPHTTGLHHETGGLAQENASAERGDHGRRLMR